MLTWAKLLRSKIVQKMASGFYPITNKEVLERF